MDSYIAIVSQVGGLQAAALIPMILVLKDMFGRVSSTNRVMVTSFILLFGLEAYEFLNREGRLTAAS